MNDEHIKFVQYMVHVKLNYFRTFSLYNSTILVTFFLWFVV
jgi:hypothetical protein